MKILRLSVIALLLLSLLSACSLKKNTAASRNYMAFITRYNIYFNGDEHYKTTLKELETKYNDDYTRTLLLHPAEAHADEKREKPTGDFTRSIEKAQKAIQLRSIKKRPARKGGKGNDPEYKKWLKREEYNPFLHNAWMMMGRSQYMNGDFLGAASTFFYIAKHFSWLPTTVTEAKLWQARSYCAVDWLFEAESVISRVKESELTNSTLRELYAFTWADYYVRSHENERAIPYLRQAIGYAKGAQKSRLLFLLGQMYQDVGKLDSAYIAYSKVSGSSALSYRTKFNARIKQSEVYTGTDITKEVKSLRAMTRPARNREYLDQIYYAIGNLYLSRSDTAQAIANYKLAIEKSTRNGIDKALAQITLGKLYFARGEYNLAQPCYSASISQLPETYPDYRLLKRQSDVLDELSVYAQNVELQDSLLRLSVMTPDQQHAVIDRIIADLKKKEKEEAEAQRREQYLADQDARGDGLNHEGNAPTTFVMNTDNSWYFYNEATRNAGRTAFQKRWGSRKLEDDWRRRNKASFSLGNEDDMADNADEATESLDAPDDKGNAAPRDRQSENRENDPHFPEYYLKQIPKTPEEVATANEVIRDGYYNMGIILKDKLNDFPAAEHEFDMLMLRYPDNPYRLDVYNNLFLMYLRQNDMTRAEEYRRMILTEYPDSKFAEALSGDDYLERLLASDSIQAHLYDRAYEAYMANNNELVHTIYRQVHKDYPLSRIMPKFMFINALAYVTENDAPAFNNQLKELVEKYPQADVAPLANDYIKYLQQGRQLNTAGGGNLRGMVWSTRLGADSTAVSLSDESAKFEFDSAEVASPHYFLYLFPIKAVQPNVMLYEVARFNFNTFTVRDFDLESMTFGNLGMIVVKGFTSLADVTRYRNMLEQSSTFTLPQDVIPLAISEHNFEVLIGGRTLEEYFEAAGDDRLKKVHAEVLPPDEYPTAEEMYDRTPIEPETLEPAAAEPQAKEADEVPPMAEPVNKDLLPPAPLPDKPVFEPKPTQPANPANPAAKPTAPAKPAVTAPAPKPAPAAPISAPAPDYPQGSEGDDPLLD